MLSESDTRAKLIDPALHARGWTEEFIRREETAGTVEVVAGVPRRRSRGRLDYTLRIRISPDTQPVAVALIEAKAENLPPNHGLEQGKVYAACRRLNVSFVFASNGHQFVEYDRFTGLTTAPHLIQEFPSPADLRARYERGMGFSLDSPAARPLLMKYPGGEAARRYYQDAAIRATLEKVARGERRALLSLATGSGKTLIAVHLLKHIADAGQLRRALFLCDRDELRTQGLQAFQNVFGTDAAPVSGNNAQKNARIVIATYQTLGVDTEDKDANFLIRNYPEHYFSHIVIDECHRSAWGKWSEVLLRNPDAVQIGLTATPRKLEFSQYSREAEADRRLSADNVKHFGEAAYEYDMAQGIEDGYLAACEIVRQDIFFEDKARSERETGLSRTDLAGRDPVDAVTGEVVPHEQLHEQYEAPEFEAKLVLPDRVAAMCQDLFQALIATGGPEQKTIVFCARDRHADDVAVHLNNLYAQWCAREGRTRAEPYAFKCTAAGAGSNFLPDLRGATRRYFVATTVDLLTTGVDVPIVRNIVFFKYVRSPIAFYQMVGRGTRLHPPTGKLMFRVYDYTDATRLFGQEFRTRGPAPRGESRPEPEPPGPPPERTLLVEGLDVTVTAAGTFIVTNVDGRALPVTLEEYRERLAEQLVAEATTLEAFRTRWIVPAERRELLQRLPDGGRSAEVVRQVDEMTEYDLYDVLAELGYGLNPLTRSRRADAFGYKHEDWLRSLPESAARTLRALASQFAASGTEALESPDVFSVPEVRKAGGLKALGVVGEPSEILSNTKQRLFAA